MNCCTNNCRQGRSCPERADQPVTTPEQAQSLSLAAGIVLVLCLIAACAVGVYLGAPLHMPTT